MEKVSIKVYSDSTLDNDIIKLIRRLSLSFGKTKNAISSIIQEDIIFNRYSNVFEVTPVGCTIFKSSGILRLLCSLFEFEWFEFSLEKTIKYKSLYPPVITTSDDYGVSVDVGNTYQINNSNCSLLTTSMTGIDSDTIRYFNTNYSKCETLYKATEDLLVNYKEYETVNVDLKYSDYKTFIEV